MVIPDSPVFGRFFNRLIWALAILVPSMALCAATSAETSAESAWGKYAAEARSAGFVRAGRSLPDPEVFRICEDQTYALCAVASCFVFNGVAYCTCDIKEGDSISLPFNYGDDKDVCTVNEEGAGNGYMVSTFSLDDSVLAGGDKAIYTCPRGRSSGAYAQCDGGLCFRSSTDNPQIFPPGSDVELGEDQIICACPITVANPPEPIGYQIAGPYPCELSFFENCSKRTANTDTGATIYVGAPTGTAVLLTRLLDGDVPPINRCPSPASATLP